MSVQRWNVVLSMAASVFDKSESDDGEYVLFADHERAVAEAMEFNERTFVSSQEYKSIRALVLAEVRDAVETAYYAPIEEHPTATRILRCINRVLALFDVGGRFWPEGEE